MGINPDHFRGAGEKPSEERAQKHEHYAAIYNQVGVSLPSKDLPESSKPEIGCVHGRAWPSRRLCRHVQSGNFQYSYLFLDLLCCNI